MEYNRNFTQEEIYMARCIELARKGKCEASPNPMVGAVIVCDGKIIGEGYHRICGDAHAEVNAINSVKDKSKLKQSTIYVSLEPCSHYGKTPPCADLIIEKGIPKVVIGCIDPFAKVAGKGIKKLQDAGIEVTVGVLEQECSNLNKRFITFHSKKRPYIILKWAESSDGFLDVKRTGGNPVALSTPMTNMLVHKRRAEVDAIIVGTRTALLDNPTLSVRNWYGKDPLRVVIDRTLKIPESFHLLDDKIKTWVVTEKEHINSDNTCYKKLPFTDDLLPELLDKLHKNNIQSIMVEGGSVLLQSFIDKNLWDEAFIEKSAIILNDGVKAPHINGKRHFIDFHFCVPILHYYNGNNVPAL